MCPWGEKGLMKRSPFFARLLVLTVVAVFFAGCSRNPNLRKQKYLESGERYFAKGQYAAAAIQFANAIQVDPGYSAAHYQLARTYFRQQYWTKAYEELNRTLDLEPENYPAQLDLTNLLIAAGELKQAQEHISLLSAQRSNDPQVHIASANLRAAQQDFVGATQELEAAIGLDSSRAEPYLDLALVQLRTNQTDAAEANFKKAIELDPKSVNARLALGSYYQSQQRFDAAQQQFRSAIEADRQNPEPRAALARLYMTEGKKTEAENFLKESKKDFPNNSVGYRMLGDFYFAAADFDNATTEYSELNEEHPKDLQVKKNYVQLLILKNRLDEARQLNNAVLAAQPNDIDALVERSQIQIGDGHPSDAVQTLQSAIKDNPDNGLAYYHLGVAFDRLGNLAQAEGAWQDAVRQRPDLVEAQRALSLAAIRRGNMAELERSASQIINLQPASPDGYTLRAVSYIRRAQLSLAEPDVLKAIEIAPRNSIGYLQMGNLMLARRNYGEAEHAYRQALDRDNKSADALSGLMNTYLAQKQIGKALEAARVQIAEVPESSAFYDLLGTVLFDHRQSQQDMNSAEASFEKSVQLDKHNADAAIKLCRLQAAKGAINEAIAFCQRAIENNPGDATFYVLIGQLYELKQDWDKAKEAYQKALEINPQHPLAANNLAYIMLQTGGNPDLAMPLAETARRGTPDSPQAADTMGLALYQKGAYRSAIILFQQALQLAEKQKSPDNPAVHFHLGLAYEKVGRTMLARQHLDRVLQINPNYSKADDIRSLLAQLRR